MSTQKTTKTVKATKSTKSTKSTKATKTATNKVAKSPVKSKIVSVQKKVAAKSSSK